MRLMMHISELPFSKMVMNLGITAHTICMPFSQLQHVLLPVQSSHKATFPQASSKAGAKVAEGALSFVSHPCIK